MTTEELTSAETIMTVPVTLNYNRVILNGLMFMTAKPLYAVYETADTGNTCCVSRNSVFCS